MSERCLFDWLTSEDRRCIRGIGDPLHEGVTPETRPWVVSRVRELYSDPRNKGIIEDSLPIEFWGFYTRLKCQNPTTTTQDAVQQYLM